MIHMVNVFLLCVTVKNASLKFHWLWLCFVLEDGGRVFLLSYSLAGHDHVQGSLEALGKHGEMGIE